MRSIVYKALTSDAQLLSLIPEDRWFENGAVVDIPDKPFAVLTWGEQSGFVAARARTLLLYVHDDRGDYTEIDKVLSRSEEVLLALFDVWQGDSRITAVTWVGQSGDLNDQDYRTNMRYLEVRIAGR